MGHGASVGIGHPWVWVVKSIHWWARTLISFLVICLTRCRFPAATRLPSTRLTWSWRCVAYALNNAVGRMLYSHAMARTVCEWSELQRRLQAEEDERVRRLREQTPRPAATSTGGQRQPPVAQPAPPQSQQQQHSSAYVVCMVPGWLCLVAVLTIHQERVELDVQVRLHLAQLFRRRQLVVLPGTPSIHVQSLWHKFNCT